jgi:hypothetical protein
MEVAAMAVHGARIEEHPDLMALRISSERAVTRPVAQAVECLSLLTGLYLAISPWVVGFDAFRTLTVNNLVIGIALAVLALGYGPAYERTHGMGWTAALLGIWTIIAPWAVAGNAAVTKTEVSNIITGAVAILLALATTAMGWRTARADVS